MTCNMASIRLFHILWFLIAGLFITQCYGNPPGGGSRGPRRRQGPRNNNRGAGLRPELSEAYARAYDVDRTTTSSPWITPPIPSLPSPEEVECHIIVPTTRRHGGRCVRLGGRHMPHACQSGEHLEIQEHCVRIALARNQQQGHGPNGQHHDRK